MSLADCPWCGTEYNLTPETEPEHLRLCPVFQSLPVSETTADGRTFVALPDNPEILVERIRIQ